MQRKRTKDVYVNHVEIGSMALPVVQMRKFAMKKLLKGCVVVIIIYIIFSVYRKNNMASQTNVDKMAVYDDYVNVDHVDKDDNDVIENLIAGKKMDEQNNEQHDGDDEQGQPFERRIKEQVHNVFEEFKRKQEEKQRQVENFNEVANDNIDNDKDISDETNNDLVEDVAADENDPEMEQVENLDDEENIADEFEDRNVEEEEQERKLDQQIEERLAGAFGDAVKEVNEANEKIVVEAAENYVEEDKQNNAGQVNAHDDIELDNIINHLKFNLAIEELGQRLAPKDVKQLKGNLLQQALRKDYDHEFPPLVTAVRQTTIDQVKQLISSVHHHLPGRRLIIYDLDLTNDQKKELIAVCGVRLKYFMKSLFPSFVHNLDDLHWKPLVMQTALAELGHMIWINPGFVLASSELAPLVHESHERGVLVVGQTTGYTTFAATHPDMLKYISTDKDKLAKEPHVEIRAVFMHNTQEVHDNIMKIFSACALETSCLAPPGSKWTCRFDFTGRKHADCHRYDESALNILLKNFFNFDTTLFTRRSAYFRVYDKFYKPKLKLCRNVMDIKQNEL